MSDQPAVDIEPHDPEWRDRFDEEGVVLLEALAESVRDIEHVGATAVPGLPARPIIDIMVGVDTLESISRHVVPLQQIGYEYLGEAGVSDRLLFRKRDGQAFDLTVVLHGGEHWQRNLRIRDFLRAHPSIAERHGDRKRELAAEADGPDAYEKAMAEAFDALDDRAETWIEGA